MSSNPSPSSKPTMELLTHGVEHHEIGDGGWLMMTTATNSPLRSPERTPDQPSRETLGLGGGSVSQNAMNPSLWFFSPRTWIYRVGFVVGGALGGPWGRGRAPGGWARPPPSWTSCGTLGADSFASIFYIFQKYFPWSFRSFWELLFLHKNNTMAILLKTALVRVSSIQIMQVRVQNKGKSVWKSRYDGDVSAPPSLNLCLSSSNSVDKLKVIKKNFYKLCLLLLL